MVEALCESQMFKRFVTQCKSTNAQGEDKGRQFLGEDEETPPVSLHHNSKAWGMGKGRILKQANARILVRIACRYASVLS